LGGRANEAQNQKHYKKGLRFVGFFPFFTRENNNIGTRSKGTRQSFLFNSYVKKLRFAACGRVSKTPLFTKGNYT